MENEILSRRFNLNQLPEDDYDNNGYSEHGYDNDEQVSDCESIISDNSDYYDEFLFSRDDDLVRLEKDDPIHNGLRDKFLSCLGDDIGNKTSVVAIHQKEWSKSIEGNSRHRCFWIFRHALKNKYGDDNNMKFAWYCTSKEDIVRIMSRGFGIDDIPNCNGVFDDGIDFFPIKELNQSVKSCVAEDDGLKHVMLCRVLLERDDIISESNPNKSQISSDHSNDDVNADDEDEVVSPTTYVIKSTNMNTHILPEYIISFKTHLPTTNLPSSSLKSTLSSVPTNSSKATTNKLKKPISPWMTFSTLILALAQLLPTHKISLITRLHGDLLARKISRHDFIEKLKRLVGVNLLIVVVKLCGATEGSFFKGEQQQQELKSMRRAMGKCGCRGHKISKSNKINVLS